MPDEMTETEVPRMRAGMPLAERQRLRAEILERYLELARRMAAEMHLTSRCLTHLEYRAKNLSHEQRRAEHVKCQGESAGDGCLCEWHDAELEPIPDTPADPEPG
jgi:hypothetical protein